MLCFLEIDDERKIKKWVIAEDISSALDKLPQYDKLLTNGECPNNSLINELNTMIDNDLSWVPGKHQCNSGHVVLVS